MIIHKPSAYIKKKKLKKKKKEKRKKRRKLTNEADALHLISYWRLVSISYDKLQMAYIILEVRVHII